MISFAIGGHISCFLLLTLLLSIKTLKKAANRQPFNIKESSLPLQAFPSLG